MSKDAYIRVSIVDIIRASLKAKNQQEDEQIVEKLEQLFVSAEATEIELPMESDEANCILKYNSSLSVQKYITMESLSLAFVRLYMGKHNKVLLKGVESYLKTYDENVKKDEDNSTLRNQIMNDIEAFEYIKQFSSYGSYEDSITGKKTSEL